ncbi:MAG: extracellular solute-binding protein [Fibrobacterota bacterium]
MNPKTLFKYGSLAVLLVTGVWLLLPPRDDGPQSASSNDSTGVKKAVVHVIRYSPGGFYLPDYRPFGLGQPLQGVKKVIAAFEERFPDTRVEVVNSPTLREYLVTQLSSGQAPDIINVYVEDVWVDVQKGWYVPLDPWLEAPNPFIRETGDSTLPGYRQWWDMFAYQAISRGKAAPDDGLNYCISYDMIETGIFYNKNIFKELGLSVPETWEAFIDCMKKIESSGRTPLLMSGWIFSDWCTDLFFNQLYHNLLPGIDLAKDPVREPYMDGYLDGPEITFLLKKGFFSRRDPRFVEMWKIMHELKKYTNKDLQTIDFIREFVTQRAAMLWYMPSLCYRLEADPHRGFEWGVFYLPRFTKKTSAYASEVPMCVIGGSGTQYSVTNSAVNDVDPALPMRERISKSERLKRVMAFLQFLCVPEQYEKIVNEYPVEISNIKGVKTLPLLQPFSDILERPYTDTKWSFTFDLRFSEIHLRMLSLYLTDGIRFDEFMDWEEKSINAACANLENRKTTDLASMQRAWDSLAPVRASMLDLPTTPEEGKRP